MKKIFIAILVFAVTCQDSFARLINREPELNAAGNRIGGSSG